MKLPLSQIADILHVQGSFDPGAVARGYSIDSRTIRPRELFFAVKGERLDGHDFVASALQGGALAAVVRKDQLGRYSTNATLLAVDDTLAALQSLGASVRRLWGQTLVGVTGSTGKTTTKEAIAYVLSSRFRVLKSEGNFNNHFGLPLTLLKIEAEHDTAVIEMGMSHRGEIAALARIAQPDIGVVTNVAPVHLEFFHSVAEIAQAKRELIEALPAHGTAVLNLDDEYAAQFEQGFRGRVVRYGLAPGAEVRAENIELRGATGSSFDLVTAAGCSRVNLSLVGRHNIYNALAAAAVGMVQGLELAGIAAALASVEPADKRGAVVQLGNITLINDCYNSNPTALEAMADALAAMPAQRRIMVAGEMLELGPSSDELHRRAGRQIAARGMDVLLGVQGLAKSMAEAARQAGITAEFVATAEEAGEWLARELHDGDVVLLKASRGVKLERALDRVIAGRTASEKTRPHSN